MSPSLFVLFILSGEEPDAEDRAGDPEAQPDSERPEGPEPAAQCSANLREAAQAGNESSVGHQTQPGETEPRAAQVSLRFVELFSSIHTPGFIS